MGVGLLSHCFQGARGTLFLAPSGQRLLELFPCPQTSLFCHRLCFLVMRRTASYTNSNVYSASHPSSTAHTFSSNLHTASLCYPNLHPERQHPNTHSCVQVPIPFPVHSFLISQHEPPPFLPRVRCSCMGWIADTLSNQRDHSKSKEHTIWEKTQKTMKNHVMLLGTKGRWLY